MRSESLPPNWPDSTTFLRPSAPSIWRPVPAPDGRLLAPGDGSDTSELERYIGDLDVAGKSVADLGCNLGYFTFMARHLGASRILGLDIDPEIIHVANELAALHQADNVAFPGHRLSAAAAWRARPGHAHRLHRRQIISKGRVRLVAQAAKNWRTPRTVFTLRPIYRLDDLPASPQDLDAHYPGFVHDNAFHLADAWPRPWDPTGPGATSPTAVSPKAPVHPQSRPALHPPE